METSVRDLVNRAGGATKVAQALGVSRQAVFGWCKRGQIGAAHAYRLARLCKLPPAALRPDIFVMKKPRRIAQPGQCDSAGDAKGGRTPAIAEAF